MFVYEACGAPAPVFFSNSTMGGSSISPSLSKRNHYSRLGATEKETAKHLTFIVAAPAATQRFPSQVESILRLCPTGSGLKIPTLFLVAVPLTVVLIYISFFGIVTRGADWNGVSSWKSPPCCIGSAAPSLRQLLCLGNLIPEDGPFRKLVGPRPHGPMIVRWLWVLVVIFFSRILFHLWTATTLKRVTHG